MERAACVYRCVAIRCGHDFSTSYPWKAVHPRCGGAVSGSGDLERTHRRVACGKRGADVRPDFNWDKASDKAMSYR